MGFRHALDQANVIHSIMDLDPAAVPAMVELNRAVTFGGSMLEMRGLYSGLGPDIPVSHS